MSERYPKPFEYRFWSDIFDAGHQPGIAVTLCAPTPGDENQIFRHAERVSRPDGPDALIDPQAIADAVKKCVESVNQKYMQTKGQENEQGI